jgi:uncharacterized protein
MDFATIAFVIAGLLLAGLIKGTTGIGYSSCALPFLVAALGLKPAVSLLVVPAIATNFMVVVSTPHLQSTAKHFWPLYLATVPGIAAGVYLLTSIDQLLATRILGFMIVAYGAHSFLKPEYRLPESWGPPLRAPIGFLNGFSAGLTGAQVMPLIPYMLALRMEPDRFVQGVNTAVIVASLCLGAGLMAFQVMSMNMLYLSLAATIPALVGVQAGTWCRSRIDERNFRQLVILVLTAIGIMLLLR